MKQGSQRYSSIPSGQVASRRASWRKWCWLVLTITISCRPVCCSVAKLCLFVTLWTVAHQAPLSSTISRSLLKFKSIESVMLSNHSILCRPLLLLPSIFPSIELFFQWVGSSHQVAKALELQHQSLQWIFSPCMISFRIDWCDLLVVQGTLKSLLLAPQF